MYPTYVVNVDIMPYAALENDGKWTNILHIGVDTDEFFRSKIPYGARVPAIWMKYPNQVLVDSAVGGSYLGEYASPTSLYTDQWTTFQIRQINHNFQIFIKNRLNNGEWELVSEIINDEPAVFENINIYASNRFSAFNHESMGIRNLEIITFPDNAGSCTFQDMDVTEGTAEEVGVNVSCDCNEQFNKVVDEYVTTCNRKLYISTNND